MDAPARQNSGLPYHWDDVPEFTPPIESRSNIQANIKDVHRSPENLSSQLSKSRARAEATLLKSKDVTKVRSLALEQLHPDVVAQLRDNGALQLPAEAARDGLVDAFFRWAAPLVPILNRNEFLLSYQDPNNQPSLLLIQAVLAAGSTVAGASDLTAIPVIPVPVAATYFDRARMLYEANYETDPVTLVQSLILMGWYWEALDETTKDSFYWTRVAISASRALGLHRILEASCLTIYEKRVRKRIWWTLLTRDCSITTVLGGTLSIDTTVWKESNITAICTEDFEEDDGNYPTPEHVHFFLQYAALSQQTALVLSKLPQLTSQDKSPAELATISGSCGISLVAWLRDCPKEMEWVASRHMFWPAILHCSYYTTITLLHRTQMYSRRHSPEDAHNSSMIAFRAAGMITSIVRALASHDELCRCPGSIVYSIFSALTVQISHMRSHDPGIALESRTRFINCMNALEVASRTWHIARSIHSTFNAILGKPDLEIRFQHVCDGGWRKLEDEEKMPEGLARARASD